MFLRAAVLVPSPLAMISIQPPGAAIQEAIEASFRAADVVVLLASAELLSERHDLVAAARRHVTVHGLVVVPVRLRPVIIAGTWLAELATLPSSGKPIIARTPKSRDGAWVDVCDGLHKTIERVWRPATARRAATT